MAVQLATIIENLKPYEVIEIRLNENRPKEIAILVKSNHKDVVLIV